MAIKVLPDEFAENEERRARFKREAKVLASLNHPGIAAIHGLEESLFVIWAFFRARARLDLARLDVFEITKRCEPRFPGCYRR